jgi:hypothetical protein
MLFFFLWWFDGGFDEGFSLIKLNKNDSASIEISMKIAAVAFNIFLWMVVPNF